MSLFNWMGLFATIALSAPIIMLLINRLAWYRSFPALFFYYVLVVGYIIMLLGYVNVGKTFMNRLGVINNLLDAPLMLLFLVYFSKTVFFRRKLILVAVGFVVFEAIVLALYGFNSTATTIILAPGLILVLTISILFFVHQVKIAVVYHKAIGKALMVAALLFAYVGYCFVYVVYYLIQPVYKHDAHLVYFLITICSCIVMTTGIFMERKRVNQLTEIKTTRRELKAIYGGQEEKPKKMTAPLEAVIINFSKK
ncbi:hypothetical protein [Terrimonas pollutisoli]|uniref:hypothetical protein n=1 Tax=Terrimonas pollutisoli TaxID=3034147 RepID=UPI0023ECD01D|nr:hypothetical protein [Terrimonas sp. H1YJ31]